MARKLPDPAAFAALPLEDQLGRLREAVEREPVPALLDLCASLRDHAPLAWLVRRLAEEGWLGQERSRRAFAAFLVGQPETAVHHVLKSLTARQPLPDGIVAALVEALRQVPLARLSSMCLIDRALKHQAPEVRDAHVREVVDRIAQALRRGRPEEVTLDLLAQAPAADLPDLRAAARAGGGATPEAFERARERLAAEAIIILGNVPKAVSQANAEELLSRRVYTDPGHFLIELLQNAEDSGARTWRVVFEPARIWVWHDGTPFDARDLVGVTSIGQTTKRKQQIGFFGVGFKSVYEVTERPQVYSDVYRFEIADVSLPKALAARPAGLPADGTLLVLPLRNPADPVRSPRAMYEKARALDAVVLLTLRRLETIRLELAEGAGGPALHEVAETAAPGEARTTLRQQPDGWQRAYLVREGEHQYVRGSRDVGRPDRTRVMVGVRLDDSGRPRPLDAGSSTVYSYLPTAEHSGLRFFVQGHFDVPVDRERIAPESDWNRWILSHVPLRLSEMAAAIEGWGGGPDATAAAAGLLGVLPLAKELGAPVYAPIVEGLPEAMASRAFVPGADGRLHRPADVWVASPGVAALFGAEPAGGHALLDPSLDARSREVALALGCRPLGPAELVGLLEEALRDLPDGAKPRDGSVPEFLIRPEPDRLERLYDLLLEEIEGLERRGDTGAAGALVARLKRLPLLPDDRGRWVRASAPDGERPWRAEEGLREVYAGVRTFLDARLDGPAGPGAASRSAALFDRLGVERLDLPRLLEDLEAALGDLPTPLRGPDAVPFPGSRERLDRAVELLAAGPVRLQPQAARLPLFRAADGRLYPGARSADDREGVLRVASGPVGERLRAFYGDRRPLLAPDLADGPAAALLERARIPDLDLDVLLRDLTATPPRVPLDPAAVGRLHELLEEVVGEMSGRLRSRLARLSIWPDRAGELRPLTGPGAARLAAHPLVAELFPDAPWLDPAVATRAHVAELNPERVGVERVVTALAASAKAPFRLTVDPPVAERILRLLLERSAEVDPETREKLRTRPAFLCDRGQVRRLHELSQVSRTDVRRAYGDFPGRSFVDPQGLTRAVIDRLDLAGHLHKADAGGLLADLADLAGDLDGKDPARERLPLVGDRDGLVALLTLLAEEAGTLSSNDLERGVRLPLYPDTTGRLGPLGDPRRPPSPRVVYACDPDVRPVAAAAGLRILDPGLEGAVACLRRAAGVPAGDVRLAVRALRALEPLAPGVPPSPSQEAEALVRAQELLVAHRDALLGRYPPEARADGPACSPMISAPALWRTAAGGVVPAAAIVDAAPLASLFEPGTPEREEAEGRRLAPEDAGRFAALAPLVAARPATRFLRECVERRGLVGRPLSDQPRFLSSAGRVAAVATFLLRESEPAAESAPAPAVPLADAKGNLRTGTLHRADPLARALVAGLPLESDLVHEGVEQALGGLLSGDRLPPLPPHRVLDAVRGAPLENPGRRARFHAWLAEREAEIFASPECRTRLREGRFFRTSRGRPADPGELVLDPDLPDLGIDWRPDPEVPAQTLAALGRHLDIGRPRLEDLAERHLIPAYRAAVEKRDRDSAGRIVAYLVRRASGLAPESVRRLLRGPSGAAPFPLEEEGGTFRPPEELLLPAPEIEPWVETIWGRGAFRPSPERYPRSMHTFLLDLGVPRVPPVERLRAALEDAPSGLAGALSLAGLLGRLWRDFPEASRRDLPVAQAAWLPDRAGFLRRAADLFRWSVEVEALIGTFPERYLHEEAEARLGPDLCAALPFRSTADVRLEEVVRHLEDRAARGRAVPFRAYAWLEQEIVAGRVNGKDLARRLAGSAWIYTDDGEFFTPDRVLGARALHLFGTRRGYWERGRDRCPALCRVLGIPGEVGPEAVIAFLHEVEEEARRAGDEALVAGVPALPRMVLACTAFLGRLGRKGERERMPIVCRECGPGAGSGLRLRAASDPGLFTSDTPTLEALFEPVGRFWLAEPGLGEDRGPVARLLAALGVRRLRDAYRLRVAEGVGRERTAESAAPIRELRGALRALADVLPRVRRHRTMLDARAWVDRERLAGLAASGSIRAIDGLSVEYELEGVGKACSRSPAVYDPARGELLVEARALESLEGIAPALTPCVYEGPGEDLIVDLLDLLLPLRTRERMDAYLNRRHFPAAEAESGPFDALSRRIGEVLDFGLDRKLAGRFPELRGRDLAAWRAPGLLRGLEAEEWGKDATRDAARAAARLLEVVGLEAPGRELTEVLSAVLAAPTVNDVPASLRDAGGEEEARPTASAPVAGPFDGGRSQAVGIPSGSEAPDPRGGDHGIPVIAGAGPLAFDPAAGAGAGIELRPTSPPAATGRVRETSMSAPSSSPSAVSAALPVRAPRGPGWFGRLTQWLGLRERIAAVLAWGEAPPWARPGANPFVPAEGIPANLWASYDERRRVAGIEPATRLRFAPQALPPPHLYAVHTLGVEFDPDGQGWRDRSVLTGRPVARAVPSGHAVAFQGALLPGESSLPLPLYSVLRGGVQVLDQPECDVEVLGVSPGGRLRVRNPATFPVMVRYEAELLRPPPLAGALEESPPPGELLRTTVARRALPRPVDQWLSDEAGRGRPAWERALAVQEFVRANYRYEERFRERPGVRERIPRLRAGEGNHHLDLLHAAGGDGFLGRGVCHELNLLVVELLRHLGVPAMPAAGWLLDGGSVDRPDHLFALALLPAAGGDALVPLDASVGERGPRAPLGPRPEPPARETAVDPWALPRLPDVPPVAGPWSIPAAGRQPEAETEARLDALRAAEREALDRESALLGAGIRLACAVRGIPLPADLDALERGEGIDPHDRIRRLLDAAQRILGDAELAGAWLGVFRGDFRGMQDVPLPVQRLVRMGLARVESEPRYSILPAEPPRPGPVEEGKPKPTDDAKPKPD